MSRPRKRANEITFRSVREMGARADHYGFMAVELYSSDGVCGKVILVMSGGLGPARRAEVDCTVGCMFVGRPGAPPDCVSYTCS